MGGNLPQPECEVRPQRLSKPRTSTSALSLLAFVQPQDGSTPPRTPVDVRKFGENATVVTSQTGEIRIRRDARSKLRTYLYGSGHEQAQTQSSEEEDDGQKTFTEVARGVRKRLSRTGSSFTQVPSAKSSSLHLSNASNSQLLLALEPQTQDLTESERIAEEINRKAHADTLAAQNHVSTPVDEDKHPDSVMAPIRRKSLYTPGIATRTPNDILRKPPSPDKDFSQADRDYFYNPCLPNTSPLSLLAALEKVQDGRSTPSNLDYSHLGGLKLGTLRVTNGTSSPTPYDLVSVPATAKPETIEARPKGPRASSARNGSLEIYRPMEDSDHSEDKPICHACQQSLPRNGNGPLTPRHASEPPNRAIDLAHDYMSELPASPFSKPATLSNGYTQRATSHDEDVFHDEAVDISKSGYSDAEIWRTFINDAEARHADNGTQEDAFRILNGNAAPIIDASRRPSSRSISRSVSPSTTLGYPGSAGPGVAPVHRKSFSKTDSGYNSNESLKSSNRSAVDDGIELSSLEASSMSTPRPSSCSNSSQDTGRPISRGIVTATAKPVGKSASARPSILVIPKRKLTLPSSTEVPQISSQMSEAFRSSYLAPDQSATKSRKLQKARRSSQPLPVDLITIQAYRELDEEHIPPVPLHISTKHADRLLRFPPLEHTFPSLQHIQSDDSMSPTEPMYVPIRFPSPANPVEETNSKIHVTTDLSVSSSHTLPDPYRHESEITISDDEGAPTSDICRSPSWSEFGGKRREKKRLAKEQKEEKEHHKALKKLENKAKGSRSRSRSKPPTPTKAERRSSQCDVARTISDFGTVTESLGGSPYDIARSAFTGPSSTTANAKITHPHQMSTAIPRAKSMIGMDEELAAGFARARSWDRSHSHSRPIVPTHRPFDGHGGFPGKTTRPRSMFVDAPPVPALPEDAGQMQTFKDRGRSRDTTARPRSMFFEASPMLGSRPTTKPERHEAFNDRGGIPGRRIRPRSMYTDAPPMPALPTPAQVEQKEAQISRSSSGRSSILTPPRKSKKLLEPPSKKDIWESAALKDEHYKVTAPKPQPGWESHQQAWAQRRKSAGDVLRVQGDQPSEPSQAPSIIDLVNPTPEIVIHPSSTRASSIDPQFLLAPPKPISRSSHRSRTPSPQPRNPYIDNLSNQSSVADKTTSYERLAGRYEGGLSYGYEPGVGLGGSAGTRGTTNGASRKSVGISQGFGIDLSDVPIFVQRGS